MSCTHREGKERALHAGKQHQLAEGGLPARGCRRRIQMLPQVGKPRRESPARGESGRESFLSMWTNTFISSHTRGYPRFYDLIPLLQTQWDIEESTFQTTKEPKYEYSSAPVHRRSNLVVLMIRFNFPDQIARSEMQTNLYFHSLKLQPSCQFMVKAATWRCCRANGRLPHKSCNQAITLITPQMGFTGNRNLLQERLL